MLAAKPTRPAPLFGKMNIKYYECHITLEPVFDGRLQQASTICQKFNFKIADLLMQKRKMDLPMRSSKDTFTTSRSLSYQDILDRMNACVHELQMNDFKIWRKKIEAVIFDERIK